MDYPYTDMNYLSELDLTTTDYWIVFELDTQFSGKQLSNVIDRVSMSWAHTIFQTPSPASGFILASISNIYLALCANDRLQ